MIAARKECQLGRVVLADRLKPVGGDLQGFVPADLFEFTGTAWANPLQRGAQSRWGIDLHDASGAFGAQNPFVHRVVAVALDIRHFQITQRVLFHVNVDATTAGAHVASRLADLVRHLWR